MASNKLMSKMIDAGSIKYSLPLDESPFFSAKSFVKTDLPVLNIAFSGDLDGGMVSGLTIFAGESKSFKTLLSLFCLKAYFNEHPEAICLFYDSEYGTPPSYLTKLGIDTSRIIHIPIEHVEQLKFDMVKRLQKAERGDKVFILVDSLGNLASKKEVEDATDEKSVTDMTRAKSIRSLLRIITGYLTTKDLPCIIINHVYKTMELYSKTVIPGGTAVMYSANQIFVITRSQEKDKDKELVGYNFTINIEKSRFVKEKSKLPFLVTYEKGINKLSGLFDLALDGGFITEVNKAGWYSTGGDTKLRKSDIEGNEDYWKTMLVDETFRSYIKNKFQLNNG